MTRGRVMHSLLLALCATAIAPVEAQTSGPGELLVGNKSGASVWRLDLASGARTGEATSGTGPHEIAVAPDRRTAVVSDYGSGDVPGNSLTVIDLPAGSTRTLPLGANTRPHGLRFLPGGKRIIATTEGSDSLVVVDLEAGEVEHVIGIGPGTGHMVALSVDGAVAYVTKVGSGGLVRVDLAAAMSATDEATRASALREVRSGAGAEGIAVASDGLVWVSNREDDTVTVHDPESLSVLHTLSSPGFPIRLVFTPDGRHALVTNARAATLSVFDVASRRAVATVSLEPEDVELRDTMLGRAALPIGAVVDPAGERAFVAISGADRIAVVDTDTWTVSAYWETGREPDALGIVAP